MRLNFYTISKTAATLLLAGNAAALALAPAAAQSRGGFHGGGGFHSGGFGGGSGFHGGGFRGGFGGYRGGYGGYRGYGGFGYRGYYGGFGVGDALLGAALIGGTAAIIASSNDRYYEPYPVPVYPAYPAAEIYDYAAPPPAQAYASNDPVDQCTRAAINEAASRGDGARVTRIDHVDGHPNGARVIGTLEVRRTSHNGEVENARFTCTADYGQVTSFRFG